MSNDRGGKSLSVSDLNTFRKLVEGENMFAKRVEKDENEAMAGDLQFIAAVRERENIYRYVKKVKG